LKKGSNSPACGGRSTEKPELTQLTNSSNALGLEPSEMLNTSASAANSPMMDCHMYFSRERMPLGSL